jgi:hypothetical protein
MCWATFWAIFSQTHLVTLLESVPEGSFLNYAETLLRGTLQLLGFYFLRRREKRSIKLASGIF